MTRLRLLLAPLILGLAGAGAPASGPRMNQIQAIGSHNSYHVAPAPSVMELIAKGSKRQAEALDYTHRPLAEQFSDLKVRQIELDVFADPEGGRFARPSARALLKAAGRDPGPDPNADGALDRPGLKVLHVPDVDYRSTTPTFAHALAQVRAWSRANPRHVPILVLVEVKEDAIPGISTRPAPFGPAELDGIDASIREAFPPGALITPDDLRGEAETLPEAIRTRGWPSLESARGKVLFALDNEGAIRERYLEGHPALRGRVLFASVEPGHPAAAFVKLNDPVADFDRIRKLVREGYLVRTRADADTAEARRDDPTRRDKALASGAQYVSTDYPEPRPEFSPYRVALPGGVEARPNPVSGPDVTLGGD